MNDALREVTTQEIAITLAHARALVESAEERFADLCDRQIQMNHENRDHFSEEKAAYEGGATRSAKFERYDLIPPEVDAALALRFGLGAHKHGANNWKSGGAEFIGSCLNHLRGHYVSLLTNGPFHDDDDIGAMLWNVGVLAWFRTHKPDEFLKALALNREPT